MSAGAVEGHYPPATPAWLLRSDAGLCGCGGGRRRGSFVAKTVDGAAGLLRQALFSEDLAAQPGLLQRLDARVKVITILLLLVTVALVRNLSTLAAGYAVTVLLAAGSRLPMRLFLTRVWLFVPIFTGLVVLPATLSVVTPGDVVVVLWHWHSQPHGLTSQGLHGAGLVTGRVATSISFVMLLTMTTPWARLLAALRALGVPRIFVLTIGMTYRYLFLLLNTVTDMYTARRARTVGGRPDSREGRRFVAAGAGVLFGKTYQLCDEVHQAMVSRGFRGDARPVDGFRTTAVDAGWVAGVVAGVVAVLLADRWLGR